MLDCRGKLLSPGDLVSASWAQGHVIGYLIYDPDDIRYRTLRLKQEDGRVRFVEKKSSRILNLTEMFRDQLDRPFVGVLH